MIMKEEFFWPTGSENSDGLGKFCGVFSKNLKNTLYIRKNLLKTFIKNLFLGFKSFLFAGLVEYRIFGYTLFSVK